MLFCVAAAVARRHFSFSFGFSSSPGKEREREREREGRRGKIPRSGGGREDVEATLIDPLEKPEQEEGIRLFLLIKKGFCVLFFKHNVQYTVCATKRMC